MTTRRTSPVSSSSGPRNGGAFTQIATPAARGGTGNVTFVDNAVTLGNTYGYRVTAVNVAGSSAPSNTASVGVAAPAQPVVQTGTAARAGDNERVTLTWGDVANETSYVVQWSADNFATVSGQSGALAANSTTYTTGNIARQAWSFRVRAVNVRGRRRTRHRSPWRRHRDPAALRWPQPQQ